MSAKFSLTIKRNDFPKLAPRIERAVNRAIQTSARNIKEHIAQSMASPKSGRTYRRGNRVHVASAVGEAPAIDTGNLANSIMLDFPEKGKAIIFTNVDYAPVLEFGGAKMGARPFFRPALLTEQPVLIDAVETLLKGLI